MPCAGSAPHPPSGGRTHLAQGWRGWRVLPVVGGVWHASGMVVDAELMEASLEAPLLVSTDQSSANPKCSNPSAPKGYALLDTHTGELLDGLRCKSLQCDYCMGLNASRRALTQAWALKNSGRPARSWTATLVADADAPDVWAQVRRRMNRTIEYARSLGVDVGEVVYTVEPNPKGTGYHAHVLQHGRGRVDIELLKAAARRAGAGTISGMATVRDASSASLYSLKASAYSLKGLHGDQRRDALAINGGRLEHHSRGFFLGLPVRRAEVVALREAFPDTDWTDRYAWVRK